MPHDDTSAVEPSIADSIRSQLDHANTVDLSDLTDRELAEQTFRATMRIEIQIAAAKGLADSLAPMAEKFASSPMGKMFGRFV